MSGNFKFYTGISFFSLVFLFIFFIQPVYAYVCPNYLFSTDLQKGANSRDVQVMQEILNLDKRTLVAYFGPGSRGKETSIFGAGTREALKRFQALFIEYIGVADGKFNIKTRTSMNAVCKGPFFTGGKGNIYDKATTTKDTTPPIVAIAGPESTNILENFRAFIGSNKALKTPDLAGLIIVNANASDLRKVSSTTFSFLVTPDPAGVGDITLQYEADSLTDLAGNKNINATNEWKVTVAGASSTASTSPFELPYINLPVVGNGSDCSSVSSVSVSDYTNPCYGKVPTTQSPTTDPSAAAAAGAPKPPPPIMELLKGLMDALKGAAGGAKEAGGEVGGESQCACSGAPTTGFSAKKGISGRQIDGITKGRGTGEFVGTQGPPPPICGQAIIKGKCFNETADRTGLPVTGFLNN